MSPSKGVIEHLFYHVLVGRPRRDPPPDPRVRHCWVFEVPGARPRPGLILEWRRVNSYDWSARVVYVPNPNHPRSVEAWFTEAHVRTVAVPEASRHAR